MMAQNRRLALKETRPESRHRVLDLGCGDGSLTLLLAREAKEAVGIDDRALLGKLEAKFPEAPNLFFLQASLDGLPFDDESFDRVVSANAWHRFKEREELLYEALRVLKPGGTFVLTDACPEGKPLWRLREALRGHATSGISETVRFLERYFPRVKGRRTLWGGMMLKAEKLP